MLKSNGDEESKIRFAAEATRNDEWFRERRILLEANQEAMPFELRTLASDSGRHSRIAGTMKFQRRLPQPPRSTCQSRTMPSPPSPVPPCPKSRSFRLAALRDNSTARPGTACDEPARS